MAKKVKSLRDIIAKDEKSAGRNIPKGEADFLAKHEVEKTEDANGNGDDVFNAKKVEPEEKSQIDAGKRHGYRGDEDVAAYEETIHEKGMECNKSSAKIYCPVHGKEECSGDVEEELTPKQKMLDKNKNGKLDADDFKKLRKESKDEREYDYEGDMAISQIKSIMNHSKQLMDMLKPDTNLPEWVQSKITLSKDYIQTAADYMSTEMKEEVEQVDEISKGLAQRATHKAWIKADKNEPALNKPTKLSDDEFQASAKKHRDAVRQSRKFASYASQKEEVEQVDEVLKASDPAGKWISDFVHSDNPKFDGKSKEERTKQALAAYYAKKRGK